MTAGRWALGVVLLAFIWFGPFVGARRLVRRLIPGTAGAPALLACLVVTLALITLVAEVLGSMGQFRRWPLAGGCLVVGAVAGLLGRPGSIRATRERPSTATLMAAGLATVVVARWAIGAGTSLRSGIFTTDSIQYHLPFAATFAQSGWLSRLHYAWLDPVWTFYPYGSEIFHAIGIAAFGRDVLSPVLNIGWLALAMLAAWCCGVRWQAEPLTLALGCVVLSMPMLTLSQPGSANSDMACLALLLSTVALLFTVGGTGGGYLLVGLAAGLAAGTTLYALAPVVGLAAGVLIFDRRSIRGKWRPGALGLVAAGGYWYLRNLIQIGNPVPGFKLGALHLPAPKFPIVAQYGFSVAHYLPDAWFWEHYVRPGLHEAFGPGWPVVAILALAGLQTASARLAPSLLRPVCFASAVAAVVYVFTPTSAYGPPHDPQLFWANLRFLLPSVTWLLMLAGVLLTRHLPAWVHRRFNRTAPSQTVWVGLAVILGLVTLTYPNGTDGQWSLHPAYAMLGVAAALFVFALASAPRSALWLVGCAALVVAVVGAGKLVANRYVAYRYTGAGPIYSWARGVRHAKIGIVAFAEQYPLFGLNLDNQVSYVGTADAHGSIDPASTCAQWRQDLLLGRYDFVVVGNNDWTSAPIPQLAWTETDPGAKAMVVTSRKDRGPQGEVFHLGAGAGTTAGC